MNQKNLGLNIPRLPSAQKNFEDFADIFSALQLLGIDDDDFVSIMDEIDELPDYLWIHDENNVIVYGNSSFLKNFGNCIKQTCYQCLMNEKKTCPCCLSCKSLANDKTTRCTLCKRSDAGYDINIYHTPITNHNGQKFMINSSFHLEETGYLTSRLKLQKTHNAGETLFLVMCSACNRMKGRDDNWVSIDNTLIGNSNVRISHGICPECREILYPGI